MTRYVAAALLLISGCASVGNVQLIDESGRAHAGTFNARTKQLAGTIDGKLYQGFYILDSEAMYFHTRGPQGVSGVARGGRNVGRAMLTSADGDVLDCGFTYSGLRAIGNCKGTNGERYQLITR